MVKLADKWLDLNGKKRVGRYYASFIINQQDHGEVNYAAGDFTAPWILIHFNWVAEILFNLSLIVVVKSTIFNVRIHFPYPFYQCL